MKKDIKQYEGFSLVEMLFTIVILFIVMLLVATTLNTVIKTSQTANSKNQARSDVNYIMNMYNRLITNSDIEDIHMYDSKAVRKFGFDEYGIPSILTPGVLGEAYTPSTTSGNEIHVRLFGYSTWTCLGYFEDSTNINPVTSLPYGYLVKSTLNNLTNPEDCFNNSANITLLHSYSNDISDFDMTYVPIGDENSMFNITVTVEPLFWPLKGTYLQTKGVTRQLAVSTKALTRY